MTCCSRSSSTPGWPTRRAGSTWPTSPAGCTTSWCTATRTSSATSTPTSADQVVSNWEEIKKSEKGRSSVTEGIPAALPALMLTTKLARKARSVGLEPERRDRRAGRGGLGVAHPTRRGRRPARRRPAVGRRATTCSGEVGELLFAVANLAQRLGVDAEQALRDRALSLRARDPRGRRRPR